MDEKTQPKQSVTLEEGASDARRLQPNIDGISVQSRLLPFWREYPRAWFMQFESVIDPLKTSDDQKFRYVLQQLQTGDLQHLTDILYNTTEPNKYAIVKQRLLSVYEQSEVKNFQKLISGLELGDQKPSLLLRKMRDLSSGMMTDDGLRIEWLNHMPVQTRMVLSVNTESSLDTLAAMADKMLEFADTTTIAAVEPRTSKTDVLTMELEKLKLEVAELRGRASKREFRRSFSRRPRSRSQSARRRSAPKPGDATWECKYHFRFGDKAKRCESPCCRRKTSEN